MSTPTGPEISTLKYRPWNPEAFLSTCAIACRCPHVPSQPSSHGGAPSSATSPHPLNLQWPVATAILGFLYISSKVLYFQGYSTGRPELRMRGGFSHVALLSLLVMVLVWAAQLLGLVADSAVSA